MGVLVPGLSKRIARTSVHIPAAGVESKALFGDEAVTGNARGRTSVHR
jgi:hypothetical protein